jgi:hypothetical protein
MGSDEEALMGANEIDKGGPINWHVVPATRPAGERSQPARIVCKIPQVHCARLRVCSL